MREFGWNIEYVFQLNFSLFMYLSANMVERTRADAALSEFLTPYAAGKGSKECARLLQEKRGDIFKAPFLAPLTEEAMQAADANAQAIFSQLSQK